MRFTSKRDAAFLPRPLMDTDETGGIPVFALELRTNEIILFHVSIARAYTHRGYNYTAG